MSSSSTGKDERRHHAIERVRNGPQNPPPARALKIFGKPDALRSPGASRPRTSPVYIPRNAFRTISESRSSFPVSDRTVRPVWIT